MANDFVTISGTVVEGHRVASMPSKEYPYPALEKQKPYFKELGLDLDRFYLGTLNISIAPKQFEMHKPEYTFRLVHWTDLHPPETFSFSSCQVRFHGHIYEGLVYYPHPETKIRHFQDSSVIEILAKFIPHLAYGDGVELLLDPEEIRITE